MDGLTIRKATKADTERIAEIISGEPGDEATAICGGAGPARRFGMGLVRLPNSPQGWERTIVAELGGRVVGIILAGSSAESFRVTPAIAILAVRALGPIGVLRTLSRMNARKRVQTDPPEGSCHIAELHVDPASRSRGIGGALLDWSEEAARRDNHTVMSLSTTTSNPARRLYERHGFKIVQTLTDPEYERITGIAGRHLMVKQLS
jgi:ribosomal protein S18 acetylase RimI-like enzyme